MAPEVEKGRSISGRRGREGSSNIATTARGCVDLRFRMNTKKHEQHDVCCSPTARLIRSQNRRAILHGNNSGDSFIAQAERFARC